MLTKTKTEARQSRNLRAERRLWSDSDRNTLSLGCLPCPDRNMCGGLYTRAPLFDCLSASCCGRPETCDVVCRRNPGAFAARVREVSGFALDNIPAAPILQTPLLPPVAPMLFHGKKRQVPFRAAGAVCLSLYQVIRRHDGTPRFESKGALATAFGVAAGMPLILSGTARDRPLERWWALGAERRAAIRALRPLGVALVTTPNFSLFTDQPRTDDLHAMKRIAITHEEFLSEGVPAALHVNARTDRDWMRWTAYIRQHEEVTHVAFEFATGTGWADRIAWQSQHLARLAAEVERSLHLILRGGVAVLPHLRSAFPAVTFIDTSTFLKTVKRQRATSTHAGRIAWRPSPTPANASLDALLTANWQVVNTALDHTATHGRIGAAG